MAAAGKVQPMLPRGLLIAILWALAIAATNLHTDFEGSIKTMQAHDVESYVKIARNGLDPSALEPIEYHHAQRFTPHLAVGWLSRLCDLPLEKTYALLSGLLIVLHWVLAWFLTSRVADGRVRCLMLLLYTGSPYLTRYYLAVPGMLQDVLFLDGLALALLGLNTGGPRYALPGTLIALLGRQSAMVIPLGILIAVVFARGSRRSRIRQTISALALFAISIAAYKTLAYLSSPISLPSRNIEVLTGIFQLPQQLSEDFWFWLTPWAQLFARIAVPHFALLLSFAVLASSVKVILRMPHFWIAIGLLAQPLLAGPQITGMNGARLSALALPVVLSLVARLVTDRGLTFRKGITNTTLAILFLFTTTLSLHHLYTVPSWGNWAVFGCVQLTLSLAIGGLLYKSATAPRKGGTGAALGLR